MYVTMNVYLYIVSHCIAVQPHQDQDNTASLYREDRRATQGPLGAGVARCVRRTRLAAADRARHDEENWRSRGPGRRSTLNVGRQVRLQAAKERRICKANLTRTIRNTTTQGNKNKRKTPAHATDKRHSLPHAFPSQKTRAPFLSRKPSS